LQLKVIISCHCLEDIQKAHKLNADWVTYSPIFDTPNKGEAKGIEQLNNAVQCCDIPVIALGGIVGQKEINKIEDTKCYGFASIRYFVNKIKKD
jgi:thiamine-phosphate pyrophosphorylase